mmetsp:Transcript_72487/g.125727  ORF Transcript_72487/g.125727 Transcript_72487/m.125727 type:complete len:193 (-) Transcript_72487:132-710(-)
MNFTSCPVKNPTTHSAHFGPGSQHGKPYFHLGQECHRFDQPLPHPRSPLGLGHTAHRQTRGNNRHRENTLRVFGDPPSARSCHVSYNKDGLTMDSHSHVTKIGSKHMCEPRADHSLSLHRSLSNPEIHPWSRRRDQFRDPTPWHFNAAFSTTADGVGKFYHSEMMPNKNMLPRDRFDWFHTKGNLTAGLGLK